MDKTIVEIGGIKMEVDLRTARTIDSYKIGDSVKILVKKYQDDYQSCPGIIIGFDDFKDLPTIVIAYLDATSYSAEVNFAHYNLKTADKFQICPMTDPYIAIEKGRVVEIMDQKIQVKQQELLDLEAKKDFFLLNFNRYFAPAVKPEV